MKNLLCLAVLAAVLTSSEQTTTRADLFSQSSTDDGVQDGNTTDPPRFDDTKNDQLTTSQPSRPKSRNFDGVVSKETYELFEKTAQYLDFVLLISGILLNILNILVFTSKEMRSPSSTILIAISACELAIMILQGTTRVVGFSYGDRMRYTYIFLALEQYLSMYGSSVFGRSVYCYTLFVASQRLIAIAFPLRSKQFRLIQKPQLYCIAVFVTATIYHLYIPFNYTVASYQRGNETRYRYGYTGYFTDNKAFFKGLSLAGRIIFIYVPLLGCLVVNLMLVFVLKYHSSKRKSLQLSQDSNQMKQSERQTTITIMVSTVVFVLLIMPYQTNSLAVQFSDSYGMYRSNHWLYLTVHRVGTLCILLSSSTNFIFFFSLGGRFRKTLISKLSRCRSGPVINRRKDFSEMSPSPIGSSATIDTGLNPSSASF